MKKPFETRTIEQAIETLIDYRGKTPPKTNSGVWLITAKVIKDGFIQNENKEFIAADFYDEWMRRGLPKQWDVLVTTEAPLGEVAQIRTPEKVALAQRVILLRSNPDVFHQGYLYQAMKSPFVQGELKARSSGTTVLGIKQSELWKVKIPWYPLPTQRKIAGVLSAYDDLIQNNTRRIAILEEMAQKLYKEWFVNFRFPGHENAKFVDSPLGKIPEGWKVRQLEDVCLLTMGQSPSSVFYNEKGEGLPFHQGVTNFGDRYPTHVSYTTVTNRIAESGDVLFSVRAPVGRLNIADTQMIIGRGVSAIRHKQGKQIFLFHQLREKFKEEDSMGGGTIFKSVTKEDMQKIELISPTTQLINAFEETIGGHFLNYHNLTKRNRILRSTRDLLLPKLISGQLDVEDLDIDTGEPLVESSA